MSDRPLPKGALPNVQPVLVEEISPAAFPEASHPLDAAYSLSLPALCSEAGLAGILLKLSQSMRPGGVIRLIIIDPLPCAGTLGRRLSAWLEQHLLANLRNHSRCTSPSRHFGRWLAEASLRGPGSRRTRAKFYASAGNVDAGPAEPDPALRRAQAEREAQAELRSHIGRMLWREVWGDLVTASSWWWDDAGCMQECLQLGTFWEYQTIEGVRDGQ